MTAAYIVLIAYVVLSVIELGWETLLAFLNQEHVRRNRDKVPENFASFVDESTYSRSVSYTLDRGFFSVVRGFASAAFTLAMVLSGALGGIETVSGSFGLHPYLHGALFVFAVSIAFKAFSLPFSLYSQFVIEARYGFNRTTAKVFVLDLVKELLVTGALFLPLLACLFWFIDRTGRYWWLWAFGFIVAFQLVVTYLYPLVIAPLFNKFLPLEEGPLRERIVELADRLGFRIKGVFVMDGSKRSAHSNAYFTGLGGAKRIVLFDTLVKSLSEPEIAAVLAHEIGHEKRHHIRKMMAVSFVLTLAGLLVVDFFLGYAPLFQAFGFRAPSSHAVLVILSFCSGPFTFFLTPIFTSFSRRHEFEADRFAAVRGGLGSELKSALLALGKGNLSNLTPHPWYSFYHYSHPALAERMKALDAYGTEPGAEAPQGGRDAALG